MLELDRPRIDVVRGESGDDNVSSILDKLREKQASATARAAAAAAGCTSTLVRIHEGNVRLTDDTLGQAEVKALDGDLRPDGPATLHVRGARLEAFGARAGADDATVDVTLAHGKPVGLPTIDVKNGTLTPVRGLELTGIRASVRPDADGERADHRRARQLRRRDDGAVERGRLLSADAREGKLTLRCDRFKLSQLDSVLRNKDGSPEILNASKGEMDAHLDLGFRDEQLAFIGARAPGGLTMAHPMLAPRRCRGSASTRASRAWSTPRSARSSCREAAIDFRNLHALIAADVANLGRKPRFAATLKVQPLPCQMALAAFPVELVPYLQGFKLAGTFSTDLHLGLDLEDLDDAGRPRRARRHRGLQGACRRRSGRRRIG